MPEHIAIKNLSPSDLTLFDILLKKGISGSKQKAINLNSDVFSDTFYPEFFQETGNVVDIPVSLSIFGPKISNPLNITRKITRSHKNFRLNGETIRDPDEDPERFSNLVQGDYAVLEFFSEKEPTAINLVLISSGEDPDLHNSLRELLQGGKSMIAVPRPKLAMLAEELSLPVDHPLRALVSDASIDELIEQTRVGSVKASEILRKRMGRKLTKKDLQGARERMEWIGERGEILAHKYLLNLQNDGDISDLQWVSQTDAAASWDFEVFMPNRAWIDAKSTRAGSA